MAVGCFYSSWPSQAELEDWLSKELSQSGAARAAFKEGGGSLHPVRPRFFDRRLEHHVRGLVKTVGPAPPRAQVLGCGASAAKSGPRLRRNYAAITPQAPKHVRAFPAWARGRGARPTGHAAWSADRACGRSMDRRGHGPYVINVPLRPPLA